MSSEDNIPDDIDALIDPYLDKIYSGEWDSNKIIPEVYLHNVKNLLSGYEKGYEKKFFAPDWTQEDNNLLIRVQNNIFQFSGAKTYSELKELRDAVYENGHLLSKPDFRRRARQINYDYNETYLEAERQQVMAAGTQGSRWLDIEESADTHPYLEYVTAEDDRVREEHRRLAGIILPVDDPFWDQYYPPNGWRCRCSVRKITEREYDRKTENYEYRDMGDYLDSEHAQKVAGKVVAKPFRHNVGTSEVFERDEHPYFKANKDAKEVQLHAVKNYDMKSAKEIYEDERRLAKYKRTLQNDSDYFEFWEKLEQKYGNVGEGFTIVDRKNNLSLHFDRSLMDKIAVRERYAYFDEIERIVFNPDEVWATYKGGKGRFKEELFNVYIKYYEDKPVVVIINLKGRVDSFYKLNTTEQVEQFRAGLLKKKKR